MEGVKADLGGRDAVADRLLVAAGHVDRDRSDRVPAFAEQLEEALQGGDVATRRAPDDRALGVVDDGRQVSLAAAVADLVDADCDQALKAAMVEVVAHDALDDLTDGIPADSQHPGDRVLAICCASQATTSSRSRVWCAPWRAHGTASRCTP